ncbi:hypothetical protein B0H66DRAFT_125056 [Apodospora peruviana]|uniref:Uncharacterized protein n=1 Tax=Apodospora peruviana TaxID=516989 RepID=A0AAE0MAL2_9PEZI|nr:hypothetical protein B0H66DRAFT_125056 [Apodospora peruviana]
MAGHPEMQAAENLDSSDERAEDVPSSPQDSILQPQTLASASSSSSTPLPTVSSDSRPSPGRTLRELVHKLSKQNLQLHGEFSQQLQQPQPRSHPEPQTFPAPATSVELSDLPDLPTLQPWPGLEVDDDPEANANTPAYLTLLSVAHSRSQLLRHAGPSANPDEPEPSRSDGSRLRRQLSSQFHDRAIDTGRFENMLATGTQCNVLNAPPATLTSATSLPPVMEPENGTDFPRMELEVDEAYCNGGPDIVEDEISIMESVMSLRRAGAPGGIRKHTVAGIPLRYQLSADAALRCQTVVRSRPRMRRRKRTRTDSVASSAVTSEISSPVIPPSIPSPHHNPYS